MALRVFESLWGLSGLPYRRSVEWSLSEKIANVVNAGFDGLDIPWTPNMRPAEAAARAQAVGLDFGVVCFPSSIVEFERLADVLRAFDPQPVYVNLQPNIRTLTVGGAAPYLHDWMGVADRADLRPLVFETHRDRLTTDLRFTTQLLDAVPAMRLCADLSHFVVGQEFSLPLSAEDQALITRVIHRSDMFHGRVASREQVQIAISWPHHKPWLDLFLGWWEQSFREWRARSTATEDLIFVPELGPAWYAITGADGEELSDRWQEALLLTEHVRRIWNDLDHYTTTVPVRRQDRSAT
jgi:hypothetical protein